MKRKSTSAILLLLFIVVLICFFQKNNVGVLNENNVGVMIENNILIIKTEDDVVYKKEFLYPQFLENITLNNYEIMKVNEDIIISISINCTEVEERGNFNTIMMFLYKDLQFIKLLDGLEDSAFQNKNYSLSYLWDKKIRITLPGTEFSVTLKNVHTYEDSELNEENEKDLISRMEHQSSMGYPIFSQGFHNIEVDGLEGGVKISFFKFVYGFFHTDIIGEIHYEYEYSEDIKSLLQTIKFEPYEDYEIVNY